MRNNSGITLLKGLGSILILSFMTTGCGFGSSSKSGGGASSVAAGVTADGLHIYPDGVLILEDNAQFQIAVDDVRGSRPLDVTRDVTYTIADPAVAAVGSSGLISPIGTGTTTVEAVYGGRRATREITVQGATQLPVTIVQLQMFPPYRTLRAVDTGAEEYQQVVVVGIDSTGRMHDQTRSVTYLLQDMQGDPTAIASVDNMGLLRGTTQGELLVVARGGAGSAGAHFVLGPGEAGPVDPSTLFNGGSLAGSPNPLDKAILENLFQNFLVPSEKSEDGEFLRRLYSDALARLPNETELNGFVTSTSPTKRDDEVDSVLASGEFATRWAIMMAEWHRMERGQNSVDFEQWAELAIASDTPLRQMLVELSEGQVPAFEAQRPLPGDKVDVLLEAAGGMDAKCVRCHAHFLSRPGDAPFWTAENRFALDAFFATTPEEATPHDAGLGGLRFGLPVGNPQQPGWLFDPSVPVSVTLTDPVATRRAEFGNIFSNSETFYRAMSHRLFGEVMERLLDPDHLSYRSNLDSLVVPNVLEAITKVFEAEGTSLKGFLRVVFTSQAYQLGSETLDINGASYFATHRPRRQHSEVLLAALRDLTGAGMSVDDEGFFNRAYGYPTLRRQIAERRDAPNTSQALILMNSPIIADMIEANGGTVALLAADVAANRLTREAAIRRLFRMVLSREPATDELGFATQALQTAGSVREGLEDVFSGLITTVEFVMR
jgi:hypothetical protein